MFFNDDFDNFYVWRLKFCLDDCFVRFIIGVFGCFIIFMDCKLDDFNCIYKFIGIYI